nr:MAG TPA: hypothetical protein [Caudoviricetes sp.]
MFLVVFTPFVRLSAIIFLLLPDPLFNIRPVYDILYVYLW